MMRDDIAVSVDDLESHFIIEAMFASRTVLVRVVRHLLQDLRMENGEMKDLSDPIIREDVGMDVGIPYESSSSDARSIPSVSTLFY